MDLQCLTVVDPVDQGVEDFVQEDREDLKDSVCRSLTEEVQTDLALMLCPLPDINNGTQWAGIMAATAPGAHPIFRVI